MYNIIIDVNKLFDYLKTKKDLNCELTTIGGRKAFEIYKKGIFITNFSLINDVDLFYICNKLEKVYNSKNEAHTLDRTIKEIKDKCKK